MMKAKAFVVEITLIPCSKISHACLELSKGLITCLEHWIFQFLASSFRRDEINWGLDYYLVSCFWLVKVILLFFGGNIELKRLQRSKKKGESLKRF